MNNLEDLTFKIEKIIEEEKATNPDIVNLSTTHAGLIAQIISNYKLTKKPHSEEKQNAQMIFLGAPTGAGKDTLVRKIMLDNPDENFAVLNMDMFRYYHNEISPSTEEISDKDFAIKTNQSSYELYYIIQEIILREFPGTNVIVTGTMKDLEWVHEIIKRYKKDKKTNFTVSLMTLAVPTTESAFSIFERYLNMVNSRGESHLPLRYTNLSYHNATIKDFVSNVEYFERDLKNNPGNSLFDSIKVYRRNKDMYDLSEDTLVYDSNLPNNSKTATSSIREIMTSNLPIENIRAVKLLEIIKNNTDYLKSQDLYKSILTDLKSILPQLDKSKETDDVEK